MHLVHKKREIEQKVALFKKEQQTIGFVPTMGALHDGHLALVSKGLSENDWVIVSIFVNPTQFNNTDDLIKYPRTLEKDFALLKELSDRIIVFAPESKEVYGNTIVSKKYDFEGLEFEMEGKHRPGHFDGVGTVLKHLFTIINPTNAYFGEKDFQQLLIVKKMVAIEKMSVHIKGCPIYRKNNGLALSSRNKRLSAAALEAAPFIHQTLIQVQKDFGIKNAIIIKEWVMAQFAAHQLLTLEYFEIADAETLKTIAKIKNDKKYRAFIAVFVEEVRLIDNIALN